LQHAGRVDLVDGIVAGKSVRAIGLDDGIAAEETADHGIVDARTEIDDAKCGEEISAVPLLVFEIGRARRANACRFAKGRIFNMDINQEVSNAAPGSAGTSPTIQQRKINSSIAIQSGEAVVLGGLIRENKSVITTGIPLLSDIPSVGEVFKTHNNEVDRTELIVIITPKVVWDRSEAREATDEVRSKMQSIYGRR
jgi:Bacterial type II and III secretion system protein